MRRLLKNPVFVTALLISLMSLPFITLLFDKYLLKLDNPMLFFAEVGIISMGMSSAFIILYFILKK